MSMGDWETWAGGSRSRSARRTGRSARARDPAPCSRRVRPVPGAAPGRGSGATDPESSHSPVERAKSLAAAPSRSKRGRALVRSGIDAQELAAGFLGQALQRAVALVADLDAVEAHAGRFPNRVDQ